jgi:hypothetical protein
MSHPESDLQANCVKWFRYQYPHLKGVFFSVPNGSKRSISQQAILKKEGALSGVSDLILLVPNIEFNSLCLEAKIKPNKQSESQIQFEKSVSNFGNCYKVFYTFEEFRSIVTSYLSS